MKYAKCAVCGVRVKSENLQAHVSKAHKVVERVRAPRAVPKFARSFAHGLAETSLKLAAAAGIYFALIGLMFLLGVMR